MAKVLIVAEQRAGQLKSSTGELVAAARLLGTEVDAVLLGQGSTAAAAQLAGYGIGSAAVLDGAELPEYSSDAFPAVISAHIRSAGYDYVLLMQSMSGRDIGARLAALLGLGWMNDVIAIEAGPVFVKPLYAGKVRGRFRFSGEGGIVTLRPKNFAPAAPDSSAAPALVTLSWPGSCKSRVTALEAKAAGSVDLKDADIIVSGGRAVGGPEGFEPLRKLASSIGAALGASRATVDAGWIDHSHQVGQTGKVVNPKLYIACGISGAIQHLAGMQTSKCIVAINSNENAPIFKLADYGLVGDIFEIVPELEKQLVEAMKG